MQIISLLCAKNKKWINEPLPDGTTPLLQYNVHANLLQCLVECGADLTAVNQGGCVLHKLVQNEMSSENFQDLVSSLLSRGFKQLNSTDKQLCTPLHAAVQKIELLSETVKLFHSNRVNFNATDANGDSVVFYAIRGGRSSNLISMLVSFGANLKHKNFNNEGVFHICAMHGNFQVLEGLLSFSDIDLAEISAKNKRGQTPFYQGLAIGKGLSIRVIKLMMKNRLKITKQVASETLKAFICNKNIMASELNTDFVDVADFLLKRGGVLTCKNRMSPWKLEATQKNIQAIKKATLYRMELHAELAKRGINIENRVNTEDQTDVLYDILQSSTCNSFARLCISLVSCSQIKPFLLLKQCLQSDVQEAITFVTPPNGLVDFIHSKYDKVVLMISLNASLTLTRIKDTIDPDPLVINDDDLATSAILPSSKLLVYFCETATKEVLQDLLGMERKAICLCTNINAGLENMPAQILAEKTAWSDLSTDFQNDLVSFTRIGAKKEQSSTIYFQELENEALNDFIQLNMPQFIEPYRRETNVYISNTIFHYFLPDKLAFKRITRPELSKLAKFGHKIGGIRDNLNNMDFVIVQSEEQFKELTNSITYTVMHLIEHENGRFKLLRSTGSTTELKPFITQKPVQQCEDFPLCICGRHPFGSGNVIWNLFQVPSKNLVYWINTLDVIPTTTHENDKTDLLGLQKLTKLFKSACESYNSLECWRNIKKALPSINFKTENIHSVEVNTILRIVGNDRINLELVAIKTVFSNMDITAKISGLEKYVNAGLLRYHENGKLVFVHPNLSFYFVADLISRDGPHNHVNISELRKRVFSNCTQPHEVKLSVEWEPVKTFSRGFKTHVFKHTQSKFFKYLQSPVWVDKTDLANHLWDVEKWIHACINANHFYILRLLLSRNVHATLFQSEVLVVLAVMHADIPLIDLVIQQYAQQTEKCAFNIRVGLANYNRAHSYAYPYAYSYHTISLLHVAALRGNYSVMEYLLSKQRFMEALTDHSMNDLLHHCVNKIQQTRTEQEITDRLKIIRLLISLNATLLQAGDNLGRSPLLVPNIPLQIIEYFINTCSLEVYTTDKDLNNILHLCPRHFTPEQYEKLVRKVFNKGSTKIFHEKNIDGCTPLHKAVEHLELADTTIKLFSNAIKVDLNAISKQSKPVLIHAIEHYRSARVLDALISAGADIYKRCLEKRTVLHVAAQKGNLTAVKYFLSRGFDVNTTDEHKNTALHHVLTFSMKHTFEIVQALVQAGANVNVIGRQQKSPLAIALERMDHHETKDRMVKLLKNFGAKL